jgi:THAP domain-containing protein 4
LNYTSTSFHPETDKPMHIERGFLRANPANNALAFMVAHNFGLTTLEEGAYDPATQEIHLTSQQIGRMSFAKDPAVTALKRSYKITGEGLLEMSVEMATSKTELTNHLLVTYRKR